MMRSEELICELPQTRTNRIVALVVGYVSLFITIGILCAAFADARRKDQEKAAQLAAMTAQDRAESAIDENLGFGRAIVDSDGIIIKWSGALPKWTRWPDAVGKPLLMIIPEEMRAVHAAAFNRALSEWAKNDKYRTRVVECKLPRMDDPTKVTHVTIVTNIVKSDIPGAKPLIVAHVYRTKAVTRVNANEKYPSHAAAASK